MGQDERRFGDNYRPGRRLMLWVSLSAFVVFALVGGRWVFSHGRAIRRLAQGPAETVFLDAQGAPWFTLDPRRIEVPYDAVAPALRQAIVAAEDKRFWRHYGIDPLAVGRALAHNLRSRRLAEGASTITQQLARTLYLSRERTASRKAREAALALLLEALLSKQRILELYLNRVPLGGVHGVEAFARDIFGKHAADLDLAESALVAAVVRAPSTLSPRAHYEAALGRSRTVLAAMRAAGMITVAQEQAARAERPRIAPEAPPDPSRSGYVQDYLRRAFRERAGDEEPAGWRVRTSFWATLQEAAESAVAGGLGKLGRPGLQAALVAIDPRTGDVLALVGGADYRASTYDRALLARRQPGSAFKPFVYAAALKDGGSPVTRLPDLASPGCAKEQEALGKKLPADAPEATLTWREALAVSDNDAALTVLKRVGTPAVRELARRAGLGDQPDVPSLALGTGQATPLELTLAYAAFANGGWAIDPRPIPAIEDQRGDTVYEDAGAPRRVLPETVAFQTLSMLRDVVGRGTGAAAQSLGFPVAGKTGTTDDYHDAWFVGCSSRLVAGVWVGFDRPAPIGDGAYASRVALPIWTDFMRRAAAVLKPGEFTPPRELQAVKLCSVTFAVPTGRCPTYTEYFKSTDIVPQESCPLHAESFGQRVVRAVGGFFQRLRDFFRR